MKLLDDKFRLRGDMAKETSRQAAKDAKPGGTASRRSGADESLE